jgi:hypothetical protein
MVKKQTSNMRAILTLHFKRFSLIAELHPLTWHLKDQAAFRICSRHQSYSSV